VEIRLIVLGQPQPAPNGHPGRGDLVSHRLKKLQKVTQKGRLPPTYKDQTKGRLRDHMRRPWGPGHVSGRTLDQLGEVLGAGKVATGGRRLKQ